MAQFDVLFPYRWAVWILVVTAALAASGNRLYAREDGTEHTDQLGRKIEDFALADGGGKTYALSDFADAKLVVVALLGNECPLARLYAPRLVTLAGEFDSRGVAFLAINSNRQDSPSEMVHFARSYDLPFPLLKDLGNEIADRFGAVRTPEVFVLDENRTVRYWGRIDDQYEVGVQRPGPLRRDLAEALEELLAGREVSIPVTPAPGCLIGRMREANTAGTVTWSNEICRIVQRRCQSCHRPGEIGPFSLLEYDEAVGWSEMMAEVIEQGRMPPWLIDSPPGKFTNDLRMEDEEKRLIYEWVRNGAPEGDPARLPPPMDFPEGWEIEPSHVFYMSDEPFTVPAEGVVDYQYFVVDPGFEDGAWVTSAECRPGAHAVVHHINVFILKPELGEDWQPGELTNHLLWGFAPGMRAMRLPEGMAKYIPPGAKLVFQMHYTPNGVEQKDRSYMGLVLADEAEVRKQVKTVLAVEPWFEIPPFAPDHVVESTYTFDEDTLVLSYFPHMHLRGKSFRFEAVYPDGRREMLLDVPRYDFNWQNFFFLREPKFLPGGTRVHCTAHFDNSRENPANPDPSKAIHWGLQSWDEMMIGYLDVVPAGEDRSRPLYAALPIDREWIVVGGGAVGLCLIAAVAVLYARRRGNRTAARVES